MADGLPLEHKKWRARIYWPAFTIRKVGTRVNAEVPVWMKYTLSIEEAARYFRIGENKLRRIIEENRDADYILWNGSRPQIKRKIFEKIIDNMSSV